MTNKEIVNRNIGLTFDFVKQIIDDPALAEQLPDTCGIAGNRFSMGVLRTKFLY